MEKHLPWEGVAVKAPGRLLDTRALRRDRAATAVTVRRDGASDAAW